MQEQYEFRIEDEKDAQRLRCPNGHQVAPTNNHWFCRSCARHWDADEADPEIETAVDAKTGAEYTRDDVKMDFEVPGVYYA